MNEFAQLYRRESTLPLTPKKVGDTKEKLKQEEKQENVPKSMPEQHPEDF